METLAKSDKWKMVSEIELVYRTAIRPSQRPQVSSSASAFQILLAGWNPDKIEFIEQFKVLLLSRSNRVLGQYELSTGGTTGTVVDVRLIFAAALKANASGIIIAHNHPSGTLAASQADRDITKKVKEAGSILEIPLLDHLILTTEGYYSFADQGML